MEVVSISEPVAVTTDRELGNKTDDIIYLYDQNKQYRFCITGTCGCGSATRVAKLLYTN
jgi:hypothetical protein